MSIMARVACHMDRSEQRIDRSGMLRPIFTIAHSPNVHELLYCVDSLIALAKSRMNAMIQNARCHSAKTHN